MIKKSLLLLISTLVWIAGISQTDKYTDKLQKLYNEGEHYKVIDFKVNKETEMASMSLYLKGRSSYQTKNYRAAIRYFDQAIDKGPVTGDMYYYKGASHFMLDQFDQATTALKQAIAEDDREAVYPTLLAGVYRYEEKYDSAIIYCNLALTLDKEDEYIYTVLGDCHFALKQYDKAVETYQKANEFSSSFADRKYTHYRLTESHFMNGNYTGAKELLVKHMKDFKTHYQGFALMIQVSYPLEQTNEIKALESKLNMAREDEKSFPKEMKKMFCIDRFNQESYFVEVYQAYNDQSSQDYPWKHKFLIKDTDGKELFSIETLLDSTAGNDKAYLISKIQGDSVFNYSPVIYDESFNYLDLRATVKKIISGETVFASLTTGYKAWLAEKKKSKTGGDGLSFETAIRAESIPAEYEYLRENYPGCDFKMQALVFHEGVPYDILYIETAEGEEMEIYFDISSFFGKW